MTYFDVHTHRPAKREEDRVIKSAGIHPRHITPDVWERLVELEIEALSPDVLAIGETGLDKLTDTPLPLQQTVFEAQARLAEKVGKPLVIHCVKAWDEILSTHKALRPNVPWIIHGFRGKKELAWQLTARGLYLSFGFHFNPEALRVAYPTLFFAETDDKEMDIRLVYASISETLSLPIDLIITQIEQNIRTAFGIYK